MADTIEARAPSPVATPFPVPDRAPAYGWYVLGLLVLVYVLNFIDRQVLSILAEDIKRDLKLTDSELGFLYGTAFAVFYSLFGIPLGRLADSWGRVRLMTVGLVIWSAMTALSGFSRSGAQLAGARAGVGVGEATASPCAYSLLSDWFPKRQRATALAIYSSGLYIGGGLSLGIGGWIVGAWNRAYPSDAPLGLAGWQAAFLAVGMPGLILALVIATLREPRRGLSEGLSTPVSATPFGDFGRELTTIIPPLTLLAAARRGPRALAVNVGFAIACAVVAFALMRVTKVVPQWLAVGTGVYAVFSWATSLRHRDPATFKLIWGTPAFLQVALGYGLISLVAYATGFWGAPYAERVLHQPKAIVGWWVGGGGALGGFLGVTMGGLLADWCRRRTRSGRVYVLMIGAVGPVIPMIVAFTTASPIVFYAALFVAGVLASSALGAAAAQTQDLVLPRMRGTATATFFIATTLVGLSFGPFTAGYISTVTGSLATGILALLAVVPISTLLLVLAIRSVPAAEASVAERAALAEASR